MLDQGAPTVSTKLQTPADIGGSILVWEVATALACSLMGMNPFASPNRRRGSNRSLAIVENRASRCELPALRPRALEKGLQLYAEGETRLQISNGGPRKGLSLILTAQPACDVPIPGAGYSFGQLQLAFAMADLMPCNRVNRRLCACTSPPASKAAWPNSKYVIHQALSNIRVLTR